MPKATKQYSKKKPGGATHRMPDGSVMQGAVHKTKKMAHGGICRGMGAATKGGKYVRTG